MHDVIPTEGDYGPMEAAVVRVLQELREADHLTRTLAAVAELTSDHALGQATVIAWHAARDNGRGAAWATAWRAARAAATEVPAAVDMAIAEVVRDVVPPEVYRALTAAWRTAVLVRRELHSLGGQAEQLAASLLEVGWTNPVEELPDVARGALAA